jgi:hypothetical protein
MYEKIDFIGATQDVFDSVIKRERTKYSDLYTAVLSWLSANAANVFVTGVTAAETYDAKKIDPEAIIMAAQPIVVFCEDPYEEGLALLKTLIKQPKFQAFVREMYLNPHIPEREYVLVIPMRHLCRLKAIGVYRDISLKTLVRPITISGLSLMNPEVILMEIYRRIYFDDSDTDLVKLEKRLFDRLVGEYHSGKLGGADLDLPPNSPLFTKLRTIVADAFGAPVQAKEAVKGGVERDRHADGRHAIVVGKQVFEPDENLTFFQLVSDLSDADIQARLEAAVEEWLDLPPLKPHRANLKTDIARYYLAIPSDTRMRRFRLFVSASASTGKGGNQPRKVPIVDVFNAANYDIIAPHPYTYLRFIMVDIWSIMLIRNLGEITEDGAARQIERLIGLAKRAHAALPGPFPPTDRSPSSMASFFGNFVDEAVALRRERKNMRPGYDSIVYAELLTTGSA